MADHRALSLLDAPATEAVDGLQWIPVRRLLDVGAFGVNAFRAAREGDRVIEEHDESPGQEELYVVVRGAATFTVGGAERHAPAGSVVFVADPGTVRGAVAAEDDTVVLAVGGWRDKPYHPLPWEPIYLAMPQMRSGEWAEAAATIEREAGAHRDSGPVRYRLACCHARAGDHDRAIEELRGALDANAGLGERAAGDPALEPLRARPDWPL